MDFEKSLNSFEMKKRIGYLIIYWRFFFNHIGNNISGILSYKIKVLASSEKIRKTWF